MNIDRMVNLTDGLVTKADKIRALHRAGYSRSQIADFLGIRYQHVRNTIVNDERAGYHPDLAPAGESDSASPRLRANQLREIEINEDGCAVIQPDLLETLGDDEPPTVYALKVPGGLFLCTAEGLVAKAASSFQ